MQAKLRRILCFGDSLTWGSDIARESRYDESARWPCVMGRALGQGYRIIEEGQGGRTTVFDDPDSPIDKNGARALPVLLSTHQPLDLVIVMLGANDLKATVCGDPQKTAAGMETLIELIRSHPWYGSFQTPKILVVSPPHFVPLDTGAPLRMGRVVERSWELAPLYQDLARRWGCFYFDAAKVAKPTGLDGVHLEAEATAAIGTALAEVVAREIFPS